MFTVDFAVLSFDLIVDGPEMNVLMAVSNDIEETLLMLLSLYSPLGEAIAMGLRTSQHKKFSSLTAHYSPLESTISVCAQISVQGDFIPLAPADSLDMSIGEVAAELSRNKYYRELFVIKLISGVQYFGISLSHKNSQRILLNLIRRISKFQFISRDGLMTCSPRSMHLTVSNSHEESIQAQGFTDIVCLLKDPDVGFYSGQVKYRLNA